MEGGGGEGEAGAGTGGEKGTGARENKKGRIPGGSR